MWSKLIPSDTLPCTFTPLSIYSSLDDDDFLLPSFLPNPVPLMPSIAFVMMMFLCHHHPTSLCQFLEGLVYFETKSSPNGGSKPFEEPLQDAEE